MNLKCCYFFLHFQDEAQIVEVLPTTVTSMALFENQLFVARRFVSGIDVYHTRTVVFMRRISISSLSDVLGLAACSLTRALFATNAYDNHVYRIDLSNPTAPDLYVQRPTRVFPTSCSSVSSTDSSTSTT